MDLQSRSTCRTGSTQKQVFTEEVLLGLLIDANEILLPGRARDISDLYIYIYILQLQADSNMILLFQIYIFTGCISMLCIRNTISIIQAGA